MNILDGSQSIADEKILFLSMHEKREVFFNYKVENFFNWKISFLCHFPEIKHELRKNLRKIKSQEKKTN